MPQVATQPVNGGLEFEPWPWLMHAYAPLRPRTVSLVERTQVVVKSARSGFSFLLGPLFAMQAFLHP